MNKSDVFISYKRLDKDFVRKIDTELRKCNYEVWVDWEDIPPGVDDFRDEIAGGILNADTCVLILSPDYLESEYCLGELDTAVRHGKRVIPIVYREIDPRNTPESIAHINWIFFNKEDDFETAFQKLLNAIETDQQHVRTHTRLLVRASNWEKNNYDNSFILMGNELREAEKWLAEGEIKDPPPTPLQKAYIGASIRARNVRQRMQWLYRTIIVAMILATAFGIIALIQSNKAQAEAERAEDNAERARALELAARANSILSSDPNLAIALALEATRLYDPPPSEVQRSLARAVYSPGARRFFIGHESDIRAVDYSPDGLQGVSAGSDRTIRLWDLQTGSTVRVLEGHTATINTIVYSPDGQFVLSGADDSTARLWDVETGELLHTFPHDAAVTAVAYSPDGTQILTGTKNGQIILWDARKYREILEFEGHQGRIFDLEFSSGGTYALSGAGQNKPADAPDDIELDRSMRLWDVETGMELFNIPHTGFVRSVCFISGGREAASASWDEEGGKIQIWSLATGEELKLLTGHTNVIDSIDCDTRRKFIVSGARDNSLRVWDVSTGLEVQRFDHLENTINTVAFSPEGRSVLTGFGRSTFSLQNNSLVLWDLTSGAELYQYLSHTAWVRSVAFSPDGSRILSSSGGFNEVGDPIVRLWDTDTGEVIYYLEGHQAQVLSVAFSPVENYALSADQDGQIILWDLDTGGILHSFVGHEVSVNSVAFSPDGKRFVSGSSDKTAIVWDFNTGKELLRLEGHGSGINAVQFSPDGKYILTASGEFESSTDNTIRLWDAVTGEPLKVFTGHSARVNQAVFTPDSKYIVSGGVDQRIILWNVETGEIVRQFGERNDAINSVAVSPDGKYILAGSNDATITLWELENGEQLRRFTGHTNWVQSVAFGPDGAIGLSGSSDTTVRTWQLTSTYSELLKWTCANRYVREFSDFERVMYHIESQTHPCQ